MGTIPETEPNQSAGDDSEREFGDPGTDPEEEAAVNESDAPANAPKSKQKSKQEVEPTPTASQPVVERRSYKELLTEWQGEKGIPAETGDAEGAVPSAEVSPVAEEEDSSDAHELP